MKINGINNSFYRNNGKVNNQPNFTALKKINFSLDFNPQKSLGDAEVLLEFKKSEPLKRFFEKYDGIADFSESHWSWIPPLATWIRQRTILIIKYNPNPVEKTIQKEIKEPEKIIEKEIKNKGFFNKIKNWLQKIGKEEYKTQKIEAPVDETTLKPPIEEFIISDGIPPFSEVSEYESVSGLKYNIRKLTDADIEYELSQVKAKKLEEQQRAEQLKNIHEELKNWL